MNATQIKQDGHTENNEDVELLTLQRFASRLQKSGRSFAELTRLDQLRCCVVGVVRQGRPQKILELRAIELCRSRPILCVA